MLANNKHDQASNGMPLSLVLIIPFVLQIFSAVGLVGFLSFRNGQKAVNRLALDLSAEVGDRVDQHLDSYLALPHNLAQLNVDALEANLLDIRDFEQVGRYFWKQAKIYEDITFIGYYLENGEGVGAQRWPPGHGVTIVEHSLSDGIDYVYATDSQGQRGKILDASEYFAPEDQWYIDAVEAGKPTWSSIYTAEGFEGYVAASAAYPLVDSEQNTVGAFSADFLLTDISTFLNSLEVSPNGNVFIIERDGLLIGTSSPAATYRIVEGETQRSSVLEIDDPTIRFIARALQDKFGSFKDIRKHQQLTLIQGRQKQFVQLVPWQDQYGLDWLVVVSIPESDFMGQINANTRNTVMLCVVALVIATVLGIFTSRWITAPLQRLNLASQAIAMGDLDQTLQVKGIRELRGVSFAFNQMAEQIKDSFETLETRVSERTAQLAKAKDSADKANRAKSEFLANMSHELRTPLNAILGYAQILQIPKTRSDKDRQSIATIAQCGNHLLTLINDVLDISKIEAQKLELNPKPFHFPSFLQGVVEICRIRAEQKNLPLVFEALDTLPSGIVADEKRLRQVLLNLLSNAVKFTETGSVTLKVGAQTVSDDLTLTRLHFSVEDTGVGIDAAHITKIFKPFEQTDNTKYVTEGTGLGLAISQKIIELMGSTIQVESTLEVGSVFDFEVSCPLAEDWIQADLQQQGLGQLVGYRGNRRKILVVDDRWENRSVLVNLLEPLGFEVLEAQDGQDGVAKAQTFLPDLIITDLLMPHLDGYEFLKQIRSLAQFQSVPIIAFSAHLSGVDRQAILDTGFNSFLSKPIRARDLIEELQQSLQLDWQYEPKSEDGAIDIEAEMVVPPSEVLSSLYEAAEKGYIADMQTEVARLRAMSPDYKRFVDKLLELIEEFDDEGVVQLVRPHVDL
ncbi:MAG: ATP-binding protein [Cyanobacteria bacterium P01_B01_bin.77]